MDIHHEGDTGGASLRDLKGASSDAIQESEPFLKQNTRSTFKIHVRLRSPYFFLLDAILLLTSVLLSLALIGTNTKLHFERRSDITGFVPPFSKRTVVFERRPEFSSNHSSEASLVEAREYWKSLVPPGQGFLSISKEAAAKFIFPKLITYDLPAQYSVTGKPRHGKSLGTSVVHSLHCLWTIMAEYDLVYQGKEPLNLGHMDHCFDYIRQVIMCNGDLALAGETFPGGSSQFGVTHVCTNWDEVYDFLDKNRVSTEWQFGDAGTHFVPPT